MCAYTLMVCTLNNHTQMYTLDYNYLGILRKWNHWPNFALIPL